ncbi:DJ-1/PfpI family protein [Achromobacter pestifer]|uniref:Isonitrile hydratase n=1 Tax=Achromobacter pestifer TaxID=1353889 RepID=A0A6S7AJ81_9BURK|nr:DJ-1/PfpI family protein [Achromobacter pestifer]CAB3692248.1 Isonitrile hydratase [Achromobacter pestifer]
MKVVCFMFPGFTLQDMVGPMTVWSMMPDVEFEFVAASKGEVMTDACLGVRATHDFSDVSKTPDVLLVPGGGLPVFEAMQDDALLDAMASVGAGAKWVTSVCSGSMLLGAAGLLQGYRSASHWSARPFLHKFGAIADEGRVVIDRNRASGGGITAGIDFGLVMVEKWAGIDAARTIELVMEYAPEPPNGCGRPELADSATLAQARVLTDASMPEHMADAAARRRGFVSGVR